MARHHMSLILGIVFMVLALISALSGKCLVKYRGIVSCAEDPKMFWQTITLCCLLGLFFLGLYVHTSK